MNGNKNQNGRENNFDLGENEAQVWFFEKPVWLDQKKSSWKKIFV